MSGKHQITYAIDFGRGGIARQRMLPSEEPMAGRSIPRIARLMALAIRFEGLVRSGTIRDYAELARRGRVTRARMTQIIKLLDLAPDIQEQILFLAAYPWPQREEPAKHGPPDRLERAAAHVPKGHRSFKHSRGLRASS